MMPSAFTWVPFLAAVAMFTAAHWLVLKFVDPDFRNALKLSRGVAAVALTVLGIAALIAAIERWPTAFVYRQEHGDWMRIALLWVYGHFVSDVLWMAWGRLALAAPVRIDLVFHHVLGVVAFTFALSLEVGYALGLIVMITEVLPISTGLKGLASTLDKPQLAALAERSHVHLLLWIRLPLWLALLALSSRVLLTGSADGLELAYAIVSGGLLVLIALDVFWTWDCLRRTDAV